MSSPGASDKQSMRTAVITDNIKKILAAREQGYLGREDGVMGKSISCADVGA